MYGLRYDTVSARSHWSDWKMLTELPTRLNSLSSPENSWLLRGFRVGYNLSLCWRKLRYGMGLYARETHVHSRTAVGPFASSVMHLLFCSLGNGGEKTVRSLFVPYCKPVPGSLAHVCYTYLTVSVSTSNCLFQRVFVATVKLIYFALRFSGRYFLQVSNCNCFGFEYVPTSFVNAALLLLFLEPL